MLVKWLRACVLAVGASVLLHGAITEDQKAEIFRSIEKSEYEIRCNPNSKRTVVQTGLKVCDLNSVQTALVPSRE
jgi:hypothetical protein